MNRKRKSLSPLQSPKGTYKKRSLDEINCENKNIRNESCQVESPTKIKDKKKKLNHDSVSEDTNNFHLKTQTEFDNVAINESPQKYEDKRLKKKKSSLTTLGSEDFSSIDKVTKKEIKKRKSSEYFESGNIEISQIKAKNFGTEPLVESTSAGKLACDFNKPDKTPKKNQILKTPKSSNFLTNTEINCPDSNSEEDIRKSKYIDYSFENLQKKNKLKSLSLEKSFSLNVDEIEDSKKEARNSIQKSVTPSTKLIKKTKDHVLGESGEFDYNVGAGINKNKLPSSPKNNKNAKSKKSYNKNGNGSVLNNDSNIDNLRKSLLHQAKKSLSSSNITLNAELEANNLSSSSKEKSLHTPQSHEPKSSTLIPEKLLETKKEQNQGTSILKTPSLKNFANDSGRVISSADGKKKKHFLPEKKTKKSKRDKVLKKNPRIEDLTKKLLLKALERVSNKTSSNSPNEIKESSNILPQNLSLSLENKIKKPSKDRTTKSKSQPVLEKASTKQIVKKDQISGRNNIKNSSKTTKLKIESKLHKSITQSKRRKESVLAEDSNIEDLTKELLSKALKSISTTTSDKSLKRLPKEVSLSSQKQSKPVLLKKGKSTIDQIDDSTPKPVKKQVEETLKVHHNKEKNSLTEPLQTKLLLDNSETKKLKKAISTNKKSDSSKLKIKKNANIEDLRSKLLSNALMSLSIPTSNDMLNYQSGEKNKKKTKKM